MQILGLVVEAGRYASNGVVTGEIFVEVDGSNLLWHAYTTPEIASVITICGIYCFDYSEKEDYRFVYAIKGV